MSEAKTFNELVGDLTGNEIEKIEELTGCPIEDSPNFKLTRALGMVKRLRTEPGLTWREYGNRKFSEIQTDAGVGEEDEAGKDESV